MVLWPPLMCVPAVVSDQYTDEWPKDENRGGPVSQPAAIALIDSKEWYRNKRDA